MGCSAASNASDCYPYETPNHWVTLTKAFYLGRYEVTQAQWTAVTGSNPSGFTSATPEVPAAQVPNRPVEKVSWNDIVNDFQPLTGMRLPTEAEWEWACRAGTTTAYHGWAAQSGGTNEVSLVGDIAWNEANAGSQTRPVGGKPANGFGLHDMSGNVWEWCADHWDANFYSSSPSIDPQNSSGLKRVLRSGAWFFPEWYVRSSYRESGFPGTSAPNTIGFRVARTSS
jgi:formylglycine-generating enzyme required for sulfatase activity